MLALLLSPKLFAAQAAVQGGSISWSLAGGDSTDTIKVSIIGGVFLVLAAAIPAWLNTRHRGGADPSTAALIESDTQRRKEYADLAQKHEKCADTIDRLETLLWQVGINPHTGEQVAP